MSIQDGQHDGQGPPVDFDDPAYDEVTPEQFAAVQEAVGALQQGNLQEQLGAFVDAFPKYGEQEAAQAFVAEVQRRAQTLNAPHIANSPEFFFQVAADIEREERLAAERHARSPEAYLDRIFAPGGSRVLWDGTKPPRPPDGTDDSGLIG